MTYGIYIDGNLNTRTGGNSVFFSKFAEGDGLAELEFYTDYECHILITFGFVHHQAGRVTVALLDGVEIMRHTPAGGTVNQQSIKRYIGGGTHKIRIFSLSLGGGYLSIFVQGVPAY